MHVHAPVAIMNGNVKKRISSIVDFEFCAVLIYNQRLHGARGKTWRTSDCMGSGVNLKNPDKGLYQYTPGRLFGITHLSLICEDY